MERPIERAEGRHEACCGHLNHLSRKRSGTEKLLIVTPSYAPNGAIFVKDPMRERKTMHDAQA